MAKYLLEVIRVIERSTDYVASNNAIVVSFITMCIYYSFIHSEYFYSASTSPPLLRGDSDYSIDTVSEIKRRSATDNCE